MQEKKLNFSTFILILSFIAIIVLSFFIVKLYNNYNSLKTELDNKKNSSIISNSQKSGNELSNNSTTNEKTSSFSTTDIKNTLSNYLDIVLSSNTGTEILTALSQNGVLTYNRKDMSSYYEKAQGVVENVQFSDFKSAMLNYVSEKEFKKICNDFSIREFDNGYFVSGEGGGANSHYTINSITKISENTYSAQTTCVRDTEDESTSLQTFTFTIKDVNGKCVIDSINSTEK